MLSFPLPSAGLSPASVAASVTWGDPGREGGARGRSGNLGRCGRPCDRGSSRWYLTCCLLREVKEYYFFKAVTLYSEFNAVWKFAIKTCQIRNMKDSSMRRYWRVLEITLNKSCHCTSIRCKCCQSYFCSVTTWRTISSHFGTKYFLLPFSGSELWR